MDDERAGKVLLDLERKTKELLQLRGELEKLGRNYSELGDKLMEEPEHVIFPGQQFSSEYLNVGTIDVPANAFSKEYLEESTNKVRNLIDAIRELERQKIQLI